MPRRILGYRKQTSVLDGTEWVPVYKDNPFTVIAVLIGYPLGIALVLFIAFKLLSLIH